MLRWRVSISIHIKRSRFEGEFRISTIGIFKFANFQIFKLKEMDTQELTASIEKALEEIRPFLNSDGGDISLVGIECDRHVTVRLEGACTA